MLRRILFFLFILFIFQVGQAQYKLPSAQVLIANHVQKIYVKWRALPSLSPDGKELKAERSFLPGFSSQIYFINAFGEVDSIHRTDNIGQVFEKDIFNYDQEQRLVKLEKITAAGVVKQSESVCKTSDGYWHYQFWKLGQLEREIICHLDSSIERTIYHRQDAYCVEAFDFEQEISTTTWYSNDIITSLKQYKWIAEADKPQKVIYHMYSLENGRKNTINKEYKLQADGHLEGHPDNWLRTDIQWNLNYFERIEKFEGIKHLTWTFFEEAKLLAESPIVGRMNFDRTLHRFYYTFEYE